MKKFWATAIPGLLVLIEPSQSIAQQAQAPNTPLPQQYYWLGPGHTMWGAWPFGPIMMIFFVVCCMAMMYFMTERTFRARRDQSG